MLGPIYLIISALHNLKVIDATEWYLNFAMIVLPINSVINPLLYDKTIIDFLGSKIGKIGTLITNSRISLFLRQVKLRRNQRVIANDEFRMEPIEAAGLKEDCTELRNLPDNAAREEQKQDEDNSGEEGDPSKMRESDLVRALQIPSTQV